jgi:DNA-binding beta-propeller fold protein YncE
MQVPTDLRRIVALAYSPKSGNLYVANSPTTDDNHSGIYRIDRLNKADASACTAVRIADVRSPTALAFAPDGALYVTTTGDLQKITGDL